MGCYVDEPFSLPSRDPQAFRVGARHGHKWCHLWADTLGELHAMADRIGMRREWFQSHSRLPHYDLVPSKRVLAIKHGARVKTRTELVADLRREHDPASYV